MSSAVRPLPDYTLSQKPFTTPRGNLVTLFVRDNTSDWNTCNSALTEDEYGLRDLYLTGKALDVGAHIGSVAIGLAVDNPGLEVTALEPVPPNVALLRRNLELNGLQDRVKVIEGSGCKPRQKAQTISFGYRGTELAEHHAFIGNSTLPPPDLEKEQVQATCHPLSEFVPLDFLKIDCEGCEWDFLRGAALSQVALIHGEWHPTLTERRLPPSPEGAGRLANTDIEVTVHTADEMGRRLAAAGFTVTFSGPAGGPGGFRAMRS